MSAGSRWQQAFLVASLVMTLQGISWVVIGSFDPFGWWDGRMAEALFSRSELTAEEESVKRALLAPLGATDAGFFLLALLFAWRAERTGERFVVRGLAAAVVLWYVVDSAGSVAAGIGFNALWVNTPAALLLMGLLSGWWRALGDSETDVV